MSNLGLKIAICSMIALVGLAGLRILKGSPSRAFRGLGSSPSRCSGLSVDARQSGWPSDSRLDCLKEL